MSEVQGGAESGRSVVRTARHQYFNQWDFHNSITGTPFVNANSGTSSAVNSSPANADTNRFGMIRLTTGTTATGRASIDTLTASASPLSLNFGGGTVVFEADFQVTAVPTGAQSYSLRIGFMNSPNQLHTRADIVAGIYFELDWDGAAARYSLITIQSGTETRTTLTGTPDTSRHIVTLVVNPAGTSVTAYIDDVSVGTSSTNVPTGVSANNNFKVGFGCQIEKTLGGTSISADHDWVALAYDSTSVRGA